MQDPIIGVEAATSQGAVASGPVLADGHHPTIFDSAQWRSIRGDPAGVIGLLITVAFFMVAIIGPWVIHSDPNLQQLSDARLPPAWAGGSSAHFLGTDLLGRDILVRIVFGARTSLELSGLAVAIAGIIGTSIAVIATEFGGLVDDVLMRLADIQLSIPFILLGISVLTLLDRSLLNVILVLVLAGWVTYARVIRSELLSLRQMDFILAARAGGAGRLRIIFRHLLPNVAGLIVVLTTLDLGNIIILAAALSFLGLGVGSGQVDWGTMLADGRDYLTTAWWASTMPGIAITLVILGINLLGDWLRNYLDPRRRTL